MSQKFIQLSQSFSNELAWHDFEGKNLTCAVEVDWFPRLTDQQIWENAIAQADGQRAPHENPNLIFVSAPWPEPKTAKLQPRTESEAPSRSTPATKPAMPSRYGQPDEPDHGPESQDDDAYQRDLYEFNQRLPASLRASDGDPHE